MSARFTSRSWLSPCSLLTVVALVAVVLALPSAPAAATLPSPRLQPAQGVGEATAEAAPEVFEALQRDLHLTRDEAIARIGREQAAHGIHEDLVARLGDGYAGGWLDADATTLTVAVSDPELAQVVRAAGAQPRSVAHPLAQLEAAQARLRAAPTPPAEVSGWFVDQVDNRLVVKVRPGGRQVASDFVTAAGVDQRLVRYQVDHTEEAPVVDIDAGDPFGRPVGGPCSTGFGVRPLFAPDGITGFVTAGHCAPPGTFVTDPLAADRTLGRVVQTTFDLTLPGPDRAWVRLNASLYQATPFVNGYGRPSIPVVGSQNALPGAAVCASGRTSFYRCGRIVQRGVDRNLKFLSAEVTRMVTATIETTVCSDWGDSGGPLIDDRMQAQGIAISAVVNCATNPNGPTFFQPINPILADFGLELLRTGADPPAPPPQIGALSCVFFGGYWFFCDVFWDGGADDESVVWGGNAAVTDVWVDPASNSASMTGNCAYGYEPTWVSVDVIDALGRRTSDQRGNICDFL